MSGTKPDRPHLSILAPRRATRDPSSSNLPTAGDVLVRTPVPARASDRRLRGSRRNFSKGCLGNLPAGLRRSEVRRFEEGSVRLPKCTSSKSFFEFELRVHLDPGEIVRQTLCLQLTVGLERQRPASRGVAGPF